MRAHFKLPSVRSDEQQAKPPIQVKFEIPFFTVSGIQVRLTFPRILARRPSLGSVSQVSGEERLRIVIVGSVHDQER